MGELLHDITYMDPLGKSDHLGISFCIDLEPEKDDSSQLRYKMDKDDYTKMRVKLEKRYKQTGSYEDYEKYCIKRNKAHSESDRLRRNVEKIIAREAKTRPKSFWTYLKSRTTSRESVSPLEKDNGELTNTDGEKAEVQDILLISIY
ncbi:hypothetical protein LSH36_581g01024 [Paralvinella palmiformis]|uniref:Uncharacterized protein n=1 Tax=Paralvinella palmiformis TaxID=53620 RepID=A0AAD9MVE3_9ANNE|nr:hypothetical protein LSH36_581g01024 [Paralvinella palmiformis]